MSRLFVGCRVRVVRVFSDIVGGHVGREGRLVEQVENARGQESWVIDCVESFVFPPECLEPIQDPGHQIVSWSECAWRPEGMPA